MIVFLLASIFLLVLAVAWKTGALAMVWRKLEIPALVTLGTVGLVVLWVTFGDTQLARLLQ